MPYPSTTRYFTVPAGGATDNIAANDFTKVVYIDGNVTLAAGYTLAVTGSPRQGDRLTVEWDATVTVGAFGVTILGLALTAQQALKNLTLTCIYDGAAWKVDVHPDFNESEIVSSNNLINGSATAGIELTKWRDLARGSIIAGNATNRPTALDVSGAGNILVGDGSDINAVASSGNVIIAASGAATIQTGVVTNAMLADMAANTVKCRNANSSGVPSDVTVGDTQLLIGDGTGFTAASLSGDATMTNAGVVTTTDTDCWTFVASFESGEQCDNIIRAPRDGTIDRIDTHVVKAISGTDDATITASGTIMGAVTGGVVTIAASAGLDVNDNTTPSANNNFTAGEFISFTSAKTTVGGKVLVTVTWTGR